MSDTIKGFWGKDGPILLDFSGLANVPGAIQSIGALTARPGDHFEVETVDDTGKIITVKAVKKPGGGGGGGLSSEAAGLLITILRGCVKYGDLTPQIAALEVLLTAGSTETPEQGVTENGSVLTIISGVTVEEDGDTLIIK